MKQLNGKIQNYFIVNMTVSDENARYAKMPESKTPDFSSAAVSGGLLWSEVLSPSVALTVVVVVNLISVLIITVSI